MSKIALVQHAPVFLDGAATITKAVDLIHQAAAQQAKLIIFPEAFLPGYPAWIWRLRPGGDWGLCETLHQRLLQNAVTLSGPEVQTLSEAAKQAQVTLVCGINERDEQTSGITLYNSVLTFAEDGSILNHHRKLMPTNPERMTWRMGDGRGLQVVQTAQGRIGSLICWENYMPLARYALYAQGIEIYIAPTYDSGDAWIGTLQHIAREGRCWVLCCGVALQQSDIPNDFPEKARLYPDNEDWINPGDSVVIAPGGEMIAGPLRQQKGILYAEIDIAQVASARRTLDVAGHYARPDVLSLQLNRQPQSSLKIVP